LDVPRDPPRKHGRYLYLAAGLSVFVLVAVALSRLEPAAPSANGATVLVDSVRQGDMVRQVRGPGTLVPEQIRIVTAVTAGRVEAIHVQPGDVVQAGTVLVELSNPDVQLEGLDAQRQLAAAEAELVNLESTLETQRLTQEGLVHTVQAEYQEALRKVEVDRELAERGLIARMELERSEDRAEELASRFRIEQRRLEIARESVAGQLGVQRNQLERLHAISSFQEERSASMRVVAGAAGVVQDLPLQVGQWATPGQGLARVVQPLPLKAVLRVPETQARDVAIGQRASIDTRNGIVEGRVVRIDPAVQGGTVTVDVVLEGELPQGARPDLSVDGTIEIERLEGILHMPRPAFGQAGSRVTLFRLDPDGRSASRAHVLLGRSSVNTIEIEEGLQRGDRVILSDMSAHDGHDRVRLR
jgi:HlyD family secretion protein